jgi:nicotinamidase-related amidase
MVDSPVFSAPRDTALLVVDVLNDVAAPGGGFEKLGFDLGLIHQAMPRIASLISWAHAAEVPIIRVTSAYDPAYLPESMRERFTALGLPLGSFAPKGS